jgi:hypothetical protein
MDPRRCLRSVVVTLRGWTGRPSSASPKPSAPTGELACCGSSRPPTRIVRRPSAGCTFEMTAPSSRRLLIELEEKEWARQAVIEKLRRQRRTILRSKAGCLMRSMT